MVELKDYLGVLGAPLVVALVAATRKVVPEISDRWVPVVALAWAAALNITLSFSLAIPWPQVALSTILCSLTASGLYGQGKALVGK